MGNILNVLKRNYYIRKIGKNLKDRYLTLWCGGRKPKCHGKIYRKIRGRGNKLEFGNNCTFDRTTFIMYGSNNRIIFGDNCSVEAHSSFWIVGNNCEIIVGRGSTFNHTTHFMVEEENARVIVGEDCMFANTITVRNADSHKIYSMDTGERLNNPKDIHIGNHVWIAARCMILKGVKIGEGSVVGANSIVTKDIPQNVIAAGVPANIVKQNIEWRY